MASPTPGSAGLVREPVVESFGYSSVGSYVVGQVPPHEGLQAWLEWGERLSEVSLTSFVVSNTGHPTSDGGLQGHDGGNSIVARTLADTYCTISQVTTCVAEGGAAGPRLLLSDLRSS